MRRELFVESELQSIYSETPDLKFLSDSILSFSPDFLSINFPKESQVPIASVYFQYTYFALEGAVFSLSESISNQIYYLIKMNPPDKIASVLFALYYADNAALRIFAAREQLFKAILTMLDIKENELVTFKKENKLQNRTKLENLCDFLNKYKSSLTITESITKLADSKAFKNTIKYRNDWVHDGPPLVEGAGILYKPENRWETLAGSKHLKLGRADKPAYSLEAVIGFIKPATFQFAETLTVVIEFYKDLLKSHNYIIL